MNEMVHKRGLLRWSLSLIRCSVQLHYGTVSEVPHGPICLDITDLGVKLGLNSGVTNGLCEHCDFFASTSRDKKFALRAASSLESTTREQRALIRQYKTIS